MANGWIFPSNNYGMVTGIGEASIETFRVHHIGLCQEKYVRILWMHALIKISQLL